VRMLFNMMSQISTNFAYEIAMALQPDRTINAATQKSLGLTSSRLAYTPSMAHVKPSYRTAGVTVAEVLMKDILCASVL
jgi:hypothetical protein